MVTVRMTFEDLEAFAHLIEGEFRIIPEKCVEVFDAQGNRIAKALGWYPTNPDLNSQQVEFILTEPRYVLTNDEFGWIGEWVDPEILAGLGR